MNIRRWWKFYLMSVLLLILGGLFIHEFYFKKQPAEKKITYHEIEEIVLEGDAAYRVYYLDGYEVKELLLWKSRTKVVTGIKEETTNFFITIPGNVYSTYEVYIKRSELKELVHSRNKVVPVINKGYPR